MIPVHDAIPIRTRPVLTWALLALLAALAFVPHSAGSPGAGRWWPMRLLDQVAAHADWVHLASNMLALWVFGPVIEDRLGHGRYAAFAAACALAGAAAALTLRVPMPAGTTGLAAGLAAAYTLQYPRSRVVVPMPAMARIDLADVPAWFISAFWVAIQLVDLVPPRAMAAGAATGAIGLLVARRPERLAPDWWSPMSGIGDQAAGDRGGAGTGDQPRRGAPPAGARL